MAWWTQAGLTTTIAHDALNGGGDRVANRLGGTNALLLSNASYPGKMASIIQDPGEFWGIQGDGSLPIQYNAAVTRPGSGACVALIRPDTGQVVLNWNELDSTRYLLNFYQDPGDLNFKWAMSDNNPVLSPGNKVWQCVGVQWTTTNYRLYINGSWADIARPTSSSAIMPTTLKGMCYGSNYLRGNLAAMGVWSGTVTLALLQNIESMMRSELAATATTKTGIVYPGIEKSSNGDQGQVVGSPNAKGYLRVTGKKDIYFGGGDSIKGVVTVENVPTGGKLVRLFDKASALLVGETVSAAGTGAYEFNGLDGRKEYFVVAHDNIRVYNAVISDMIVVN